MKRVVSIALASWLFSPAAYAHHSNAEYDRTALRELEGELGNVETRLESRRGVRRGLNRMGMQ